MTRGDRHADANRILAFLLGGNEVTKVWGPDATDFFDPTRRRVARRGVVTDGCWLWPASLAYYFNRYNVVLPLVFIEHALASDERPLLHGDDLTAMTMLLERFRAAERQTGEGAG